MYDLRTPIWLSTHAESGGALPSTDSNPLFRVSIIIVAVAVYVRGVVKGLGKLLGAMDRGAIDLFARLVSHGAATLDRGAQPYGCHVHYKN